MASVLDGGFRIEWLAGQPLQAQLGSLSHVCEDQHATWVTPLGHLAIYHREAEAESAAHWEVECFLRSDVDFQAGRPVISRQVTTPNYPAPLMDVLLEALLVESRLEEPVVLNVHHFRNVAYRQKGPILDDEQDGAA